jgi:glycosyltransferase involved in cell wall biosynthesis
VTPVRLLHVVRTPVQYFAPLYRELAGRGEVDLTVAFLTSSGAGTFLDRDFGREVRWDVPVLEGYRHWFLPGSWRRRSLAAAAAVLAGRYDAVWIHGYTARGAWLVVAAAVLRRVPVLVRDDATLLRRRSPARRLVKAALLPLLFRFVHGLCCGVESRRFFERYGLRGGRLFLARHSVDNAFFRRHAAELAGRRAALRRSFGLPADQPVVLQCGKLYPVKDPLLLLRAFAEVRRDVACSLLFAGDGPLRAEVEAFAARAAIPDVRVTGFLNQSELPRAYAAADVLALCSQRETWGLVVNEAMNFGLPVVVSDRVGCAADLVAEGENGLVVPAGSVGALATALRTLVGDPAVRRRWGARSRELVDAYDVSRTADEMVAAVLRVVRTRALTARAAGP